jgi:hypothetical protein
MEPLTEEKARMKTIAALFAAILIALTVAACAGQPTQETQTAPAAGTESQAQAPAAHQGEAAAPAEAPAAHEGESAAPAEAPAAPQN